MKVILFVFIISMGLMQSACIRPVPRAERPSPPAAGSTDSARGMSEPYDAVQLGGDVFEAQLGQKKTEATNEVFGYRVQIAAVGDESAANAIRDKVVTEFRMPVYISHEAPFWFVRMGDFRTMTEAEESKKGAIAKGYDGARVIEDKIIIGE